MKCLVCFLHIAKRLNHLGCMSRIIFTNIFDRTSPIRSYVIHNTTDNFTLFVGYFTLGLSQPQVEILLGCSNHTIQSLYLVAKRTSCMMFVKASLSSLVVERFTLLGERMAYEFHICFGVK